jgi:dTDP-4-dehydrorhamnose reductase
LSASPRILLLGAIGQLGAELQRSFAGRGEIISCTRDRVDLAAEDQLRSLVRDTAPSLILNAAAYTAVDKAESEPELARGINAVAPRILAEEALRNHTLLVHYSTDYVFDGSKTAPWSEDDQTRPLNVYGASKLAGEEAIRQVGGRYLIFRTSWVYGPRGKNFLLTMLRLGQERDQLRVVDDQIGAPTSSAALADATRAVIDAILGGPRESEPAWSGVYHMTCGGAVSWYGFAQAIFDRAHTMLNARVPALAPISSGEYPTPAQRPRNSVLSCEKLQRRFGVRLPDWLSALDDVLRELSARRIPA